jgi:hypothetical protein
MTDLSVERLKEKINLELIKPKNALKKSQLTNDLIVVLKQKITEYPSTYNLKLCNEFLLYVCKIVEELIKKSDGINKKELVKELFKILFDLQSNDLLLIDSSIDFLWSNELICKVALSKKSLHWLKRKSLCFV